MKFWKYPLITVLAFLGIASTVLYTSCEQDSCLVLRCRNGATCAGGFCQCPDGYEGQECGYTAVQRFVGVYDGITQYQGVPSFTDSGVVFVVKNPNVIGIYKYSNPTDTIIGTISGEEVIVDDANNNKYARINMATPTQVVFYLNEKVNDSTVITTFRGNLRPGTDIR